jgi:hypothetical protein
MPTKATHTHNSEEVRFVHRLAASLAESHEAFSKFCVGPGRDSSSHHGPLPAADELAKWKVFVEEKVLPLNSVTAKLIESHRHLWDELPVPLADFIDYHSSLLARHSAWKDHPTVPSSFQADRDFPRSINAWVLEQLRDLMRSVAASSLPRS